MTSNVFAINDIKLVESDWIIYDAIDLLEDVEKMFHMGDEHILVWTIMDISLWGMNVFL